MVVVTSKMRTTLEKREEFLKALRGMLEPMRLEPGCRCFILCHDYEDESICILVEEWEAKEDFDRHLRGNDYRKLLVLMDLLSEPPEIKINIVSRSAGMEYLEEVLGMNR
jgi:quinol monooxygenase YgiN